MSITVKAKCLKNVYKNGDYRIFSWSPIEKDKELKLSNYFTFSTKEMIVIFKNRKNIQ